MRDQAMGCAIFVGALAISLSMGYSLGKHAGYDQALRDLPKPKTTDQQCVAWLFEANMKDVKKRICK